MCVLKMKFLPSAVQKLSSEQTDRQTDRQTRLKLLPTAYADGKKLFSTNSVDSLEINYEKVNCQLRPISEKLDLSKHTS